MDWNAELAAAASDKTDIERNGAARRAEIAAQIAARVRAEVTRASAEDRDVQFAKLAGRSEENDDGSGGVTWMPAEVAVWITAQTRAKAKKKPGRQREATSPMIDAFIRALTLRGWSRAELQRALKKHFPTEWKAGTRGAVEKRIAAMKDAGDWPVEAIGTD